MQKLNMWLKKRDVVLKWITSNREQVIFNPKGIEVFIDKRANYQVRLATLLHECGHVDCYLERCKNKRKNIDGLSHSEYFSLSGRMKKYRIRTLAILQDEIAAWDRGEKLARNLKIRFSRKIFERERSMSLWTYLPKKKMRNN